MKRPHLDWPPVWLAGFVALLWAQARWLPLAGFGDAGRVIGAGFICAGVGLLLVAAFWMARAGTTVIPHEMPTALVSSGPFAISRNPIYLADAMVLAGLGLWWGALSVIPLLPLFMAIITRRFIRPEEARLAASFGSAYDQWAGRVRRWL